jgi:metal-dependent amidase/aminoacylase/carboxypeptidase family protein
MSTESATSRDSAILEAVSAQRQTVLDVTHFIHAHPELAHEEVEDAAYLVRALSAGLEVELGFGGMPTGFRATLKGTKPGPTIAVAAVYDAVGVPRPDGGMDLLHSCGHGPVAGGIVGAALALAAVREEMSGTLVVLGCPADELVSPLAITLGSGKALSLANGAWSGIDAALYIHPESATGVWRSSRWMQLFELQFSETQDTAAWELPFDRYRIDGVSVNDDGSSQVILRVLGDTGEMIDERADEVRSKLSPLSWTPLGRTEGLVADARVQQAAEGALAALGLDFTPETPMMPFSTDFGNITRQIPSAMIGVTREGGWAVHTEEGERQFLSSEGDDVAVTMSQVLALAIDRSLRLAL